MGSTDSHPLVHLLERILTIMNEEGADLSDLPDDHSAFAQQMVGGLGLYLHELIADGITNFEPPSEYDPAEVELLDESVIFSLVLLPLLWGAVIRLNDTLSKYSGRFRAGYRELGAIASEEKMTAALFEADNVQQFTRQADAEGQFYEAVFLFISVQDGLMSWLCEQHSVEPNNGSYYTSGEKREMLRRTYRENSKQIAGVEPLVDSDRFVDRLNAFYAHRNAIMHGDPVAYFDINIACITSIFLLLTVHTVLASENGYEQLLPRGDQEDLIRRLIEQSNIIDRLMQ